AGLGAFAWAFGEAVDARDVAIAKEQETEKERKKTADALKDTEEARKKTADALKDTEKARQLADAEKRKAQKELLRAESLMYVMVASKAHKHFLDNDFIACRRALDECRWDLRGPEYGYLSQELMQQARTFRGHTAPVTSLVLSNDGKRLYSAGR